MAQHYGKQTRLRDWGIEELTFWMFETVLNDNDEEMVHLRIKQSSDPKFIFPSDVGLSITIFFLTKYYNLCIFAL